jgi:hypothetical protein
MHQILDTFNRLVLMAPVMVLLLLVEFVSVTLLQLRNGKVTDVLFSIASQTMTYFAKQSSVAYGNRVNHQDLEQVNTTGINTTFRTTSSSNFAPPPPRPHRYRIRRAYPTYRGVRI